MRRHSSGRGNVMISGLAIQNGAYPGGLGGYPQLFTIESMTAPASKPPKPAVEFANQCYGAEQSQTIESACGKPLFVVELANFPSFNACGIRRISSSKSIAEQLESAQTVIARFRKLTDKAEQVSRHDREKNWLAANRHEFRGRWIALDGDKLLATGTSSKEVFAAVGKHKPTPLVMQIAEQESSFPGW
jgi:hypothetical protein